MELLEILARYDREERAEPSLSDPAIRLERTAAVVRTLGPGREAGDNQIVFSRLDAATADAEIERQIAHFAALGRQFEWKTYAHDLPPDLPARLAARGLVAGTEESVVVRPTERPLVVGDTGAELVRLTTPDRLADLLAVHREVWADDCDGFIDGLAREMTDAPDTLSIYVAYLGGEPVATGWSRFPRGRSFAGFYGGTTRAAYRRHGLYRALVAVRLREASERGYPLAYVEAGPESRPLLLDLGFVELTRTTPYTSRPAGDAQRRFALETS